MRGGGLVQCRETVAGLEGAGVVVAELGLQRPMDPRQEGLRLLLPTELHPSLAGALASQPAACCCTAP